jgi:hypothetical protein
MDALEQGRQFTRNADVDVAIEQEWNESRPHFSSEVNPRENKRPVENSNEEQAEKRVLADQ